MVQAIAEGLTLGEFEGGRYKTTAYEPFDLTAVGIVVGEPLRAAATTAAQRGRLIGEYCNIARQLGNEPGNALSPAVLADRLATIARSGGLAVDVLDHHELERLGMGMLLGVGRGSAEPPCLVAIRYEPVGAPATPLLGYVGKGITFDTGGISIKPAADMERMKNDMAGGAAVACAMRAIADLQIPVRCVGVIPIAENMPGGRALRPGDILKSASGITVEVVNTDAEGRLILGDGLWYARTLGATHLIDIATLTGAISVALGRITTGLFGTPPSFADQVRPPRSARRSILAAAAVRRVQRSCCERSSHLITRRPSAARSPRRCSSGVHRRSALALSTLQGPRGRRKASVHAKGPTASEFDAHRDRGNLSAASVAADLLFFAAPSRCRAQSRQEFLSKEFPLRLRASASSRRLSIQLLVSSSVGVTQRCVARLLGMQTRVDFAYPMMTAARTSPKSSAPTAMTPVKRSLRA